MDTPTITEENMSKKIRLFSSLNAAMECGHAVEATHIRYSVKNPTEPAGGGWSDLFGINADLKPEAGTKCLKVQYVRDNNKFCFPYVYVVPAEQIGFDGDKKVYVGPVDAIKGTPIDDISKLDLEEQETSGGPETAAPPTSEAPADPTAAGESKDVRSAATAAAAGEPGRRRGPRTPAAGPRTGRGISNIIGDMDTVSGRLNARGAEIEAAQKSLAALQAEQAKDVKALNALIGEADAAQRATSELLASLL